MRPSSLSLPIFFLPLLPPAIKKGNRLPPQDDVREPSYAVLDVTRASDELVKYLQDNRVTPEWGCRQLRAEMRTIAKGANWGRDVLSLIQGPSLILAAADYDM